VSDPAPGSRRAAWALVGAPVWAGPERGIVGNAVAFDSSGRVAAVGREHDVRARAPRGAEVVRLDGGLVVPGFVDAHVHLRACASALLSVDADGVDSVGRLLDLVARAAAGRLPGAWVRVAGFEPRVLGRELMPTRRELDQVAPSCPVGVRHRSLHAWLLNSAGLRVAGLSRPAPLPRGVLVLRDEAGEPTGWVMDHAGGLRARLGTAWPPVALEEAVAEWSRIRLREGLVALADASASNGPDQLAQLAQWRARGLLAQHVAALSAGQAPASTALEVPARKLLPEPGSGPDPAMLLEAWGAGQGVAVHCADLEGLGALLEAVERVPAGCRGPLRIEHASQCPPEWLPRVARCGATVVTHPGFVHAHGDRYLAVERPLPAGWLYRMRSWLVAGVRLAVGSDAPAGPVAPLTAWRTAITRRTRGGQVLGGDESVGPATALAAMTAWAADCSGLGGYGRIAEGGPGAAVLLEGEPLAGVGHGEVRVGMVVAGGTIVPAGP
jgi:predicted amidohydrolase YtcJ